MDFQEGGFKSRLYDFVKFTTNTINKGDLSVDIKKEVLDTIRKISKALKEIKDTEIQSIEIELNEALDVFLEKNRKNVIKIISENRLYSSQDLEYIKTLFGLPENFDSNVLYKILKNNFKITIDNEDKIDDIFELKNDVCLLFLLQRLGFNHEIIKHASKLMKGELDVQSISYLIDITDYIDNIIIKKIVFEKLTKCKSFNLDSVLHLLEKSKLKNEIMSWFTYEGNINLDDSKTTLKTLIHKIKDNDISIFFEKIGILKSEFKTNLIKLIIEDQSINNSTKTEILKNLYEEHPNEMCEILGINKSGKDILDNILKGNPGTTKLDRLEAVLNSNSENGKFILFKTLFGEFSVDNDLQEIIKDCVRKNKLIEESKNKIYNDIQTLLGIPNINITLLLKPKKNNILSKLFGYFRKNNPKSESLKITNNSPISILLQVLKLESKLTDKTKANLIKYVFKIISKTKTYEGRKIIFDLYFIKIKGIDIEYNLFLDLLLENGYIKDVKTLNENKGLKYFLREFGDNSEIIGKTLYLMENCDIGNSFSVLFSDFIVKMIKDQNIEEIKEILNDLRIKPNEPVDIVGFANIEGKIKEKIKRQTNPKTTVTYTNFLSIDYDISSIMIILKKFSLELNEESYDKIKNIIDFLKINLWKASIDGYIINDKIKDFKKIRKNLVTIFQMFPEITIKELQNPKVLDIIKDFDNEPLEFLRKENEFSKRSVDNEEKSEIITSILENIKIVLQQENYEQGIKIKRILKELDEVFRHFRIDLTLEGLVNNKDNPFITKPGKLEHLIIAIYRHIIYCLRDNPEQNNKIRSLRNKISGVDGKEEDDFKIAQGVIIKIDFKELLYLIKSQEYILEVKTLKDLVWKYIFQNNTIIKQ